MKEFELIARLTRDLPTNDSVVAGAGDDCALLDLGIPGRFVVFKTDAVVEGVHFTADAPGESVGHKALARVLSDFAAAAATPTAALITLALPTPVNLPWIDALYAGIRALAQRWSVAIVGGETTAGPDRTVVSVAALGTVARERTVRRSGARAGDVLFVSGQLGGSIAGRHLDFEPRLAEARWLADHHHVHAMIDLSDGLATDLRHVLQASQVGAELFTDTIPISRAAKLRARGNSSAKPALLAALTDGEDFELLFAVASADAVPVLDGWRARFPKTTLTCIGRLIDKPGLQLRTKQGIREFTGHGYTHFA